MDKFRLRLQSSYADQEAPGEEAADIEEIDLSYIGTLPRSTDLGFLEDETCARVLKELGYDPYIHGKFIDPFGVLSEAGLDHLHEELLLDPSDLEAKTWQSYIVPEQDRDRYLYSSGFKYELSAKTFARDHVEPVDFLYDPATGEYRAIRHFQHTIYLCTPYWSGCHRPESFREECNSKITCQGCRYSLRTSMKERDEYLYGQACTETFTALPIIEGVFTASSLRERFDVSHVTAKKMMQQPNSGYVQISGKYFLSTADFELLSEFYPEILALIMESPRQGVQAIYVLKAFRGDATSKALKKCLGSKGFNLLVKYKIIRGIKSLSRRQKYYVFKTG